MTVRTSRKLQPKSTHLFNQNILLPVAQIYHRRIRAQLPSTSGVVHQQQRLLDQKK